MNRGRSYIHSMPFKIEDTGKVFAITLTFKIIEFTMNEIGYAVIHL